MEEVKIHLRHLGFNYNETKVYLAMANLGEAPAAQIAKKAGIPRTTAASILENMVEDGYVSPHRYKGKTYYWIESPDIFIDKLDHKREIALKLQDNLASLYHSEGKFPVGRVFDTRRSIASFMEKALLATPKGSTVYTIDDVKAGNYSKVLTATEYYSIVAIKKRRDLSTKTLVPYGETKDIDPAKLRAQQIETRELPEGVTFQSSIWLLNNQLVNFGGTPPFLTVQKHAQIVAGMQAIWQYFWNKAGAKS